MNNFTNTQKEIIKLKEKKDATILAHNYQIPQIQEISDFVGDSFELSKIATEVYNSVVVFCGVHFMAESAKILSPQKKVILPDERAGCPLADMATPDQVRKMKERYPNAKVVAYVNTSADVKAESDICCTSSNAVEVVNSLDTDEVIFLPDQNLANYVSQFTDKDIIPWNGYCISHSRVTIEEVNKTREFHPNTPIIVHPECPKEVKDKADYIMGTGGMVKFAKETDYSKVIIGTEEGLLHRLRRENPGKEFYLLSPSFFCSNMKKITLQGLLSSLKNLSPEVNVPEKTRSKAYQTLEKMLNN
ncbi:quinolinate synthase [Natranaerobius trueperi]|uniref:Quinolinate synthase n=1 Tax=Natranaerobius trueperi TaxID=759412 RepID=A0A226BZM1_9FIRM|nr:quinolinate synthase [Natranaerobius trueperi]